MVMSIWRKAHLWLAIVISAFLLIASVTGAILSFEPIYEDSFGYSYSDADDLLISDVISNVRSQHQDLLNITRDRNGYLLVQTLEETQPFYANPYTGEKLGEVIVTPRIFEFCRTLHRSLFLGETGRFLIGLVSLLLILMSVSGFFLVLKKQGGLKQYFTKVIKNEFNQDYHTRLSRWLILTILIIAVTGTYLFLQRFSVIPTFTFEHEIQEELLTETPKRSINDFPAILNITFGELREVSFPFAEFPDEYFEFKLKQNEMLVNQFNGEVISKMEYPIYEVLAKLSFKLHTGEGSVLWAATLGITGLGILFFIWSGFAIYFKRDKTKVLNSHTPEEAEIVVLYGSEQGSTVRFANVFYQALLASGKRAFITDLNSYQVFDKLEYLFIFSSTYGVGEAPVNANQFLNLARSHAQKQPFNYAVVGFGSTAYPDFCQYAIEVDEHLVKAPLAKPVLALEKVDNASVDTFLNWTKRISDKTGIPLPIQEKDLKAKKVKQHKLEVVQRTDSPNRNDQTFTLELHSKNGILKNYQSGDLLSILPKGESKERLYSMSVLQDTKQVLLSVRKHEKGVCSKMLSQLNSGDRLNVSFKKNEHFHLPKAAPGAVLISNGTGIAPFIGMMNDSPKSQEILAFWGGQNQESFALYEKALEKSRAENLSLYKAFSRETDQKTYVQDLVNQHQEQIINALDKDYVLMICGGLAMQKAVEKVLEESLRAKGKGSVTDMKTSGQIKTDCY